MLIATALASVFAIWNAADELRLPQTWGFAVQVVLAWLVAPWVNVLFGVFSTNQYRVRAYSSASMFYMCACAYYALNGPSWERGPGAQHMHLTLVPAFFCLFQGGLLLYVFLRGLLSRSQGSRG